MDFYKNYVILQSNKKIMKKNLLFPALAIVCGSFMFTSCDKAISSLIQPQSINWSGMDVTVTLPPTSDTTLQNVISSNSFTYDLDSFIKSKTSNQLGLANVDEFKISSCTLTIQNPDASNNFQNFEQASGSFYTSANTTPLTVGQITNNPNTYATSLSLPVTSDNLKPYLANSGATTISYAVGGKLRTPTTQTLTVNVHMEYTIHVKP